MREVVNAQTDRPHMHMYMKGLASELADPGVGSLGVATAVTLPSESSNLATTLSLSYDFMGMDFNLHISTLERDQGTGHRNVNRAMVLLFVFCIFFLLRFFNAHGLTEFSQRL